MTHVVCTGLSSSKRAKLISSSSVRVVHPRWVTESIAAGKRLPVAAFDPSLDEAQLCDDDDAAEDDDNDEEDDEPDSKQQQQQPPPMMPPTTPREEVSEIEQAAARFYAAATAATAAQRFPKCFQK